MSIHNITQKIKTFSNTPLAKDIYILLIIFLVGTTSFGLGRLSARESQDSVKIDYSAVPDLLIKPGSTKASGSSAGGVQKAVSSGSGAFVASKRGKKYYATDCAAAKSLSDANKIYFTTEADAENAGYQKSTSC